MPQINPNAQRSPATVSAASSPKAGNFVNLQWLGPQTLSPVSLTCGFCGDKISSEKGYPIVHNTNPTIHTTVGGVYICPSCKGPNYRTPGQNVQFPGVSFGNPVSHVPAQLNALYQEARDCTSSNCFTAAVLLCRKMLMNIAVEQGASEGKTFIEYVNFLSEKGYVPPNGKHWVDHIRKKGNEATHEIALMKEDEAKELIRFVEMLLRFIYEFPNLVPKSA